MSRRKAELPETGLLFVGAGEYDALEPAFDFIPGMLQDSSVAIIYGPPQSGKTFFALHLLCSAALARPLFGATPEQRRGLYIGLEGEAGIKSRIQAWCKHHKVTDNPIHYALGSFDIGEETEVADLIEYMREHRIQFVVIDTLARAMVGLDEIAGQQMSMVIEGLHRIKRETGACVVAIAHTGKNEAAGIRGHSSQLGNVDTTIELRVHNRKARKGARGEADIPEEPITLATPRSAQVRKQRDGEAGCEFHFRLTRHETDVRNARGRLVASLAVDEHEAFPNEAANDAGEPSREKLTKRIRDALDVLEALDRKLGRVGPPSKDQFRRALKRAAWGPEKAKAWNMAFTRLLGDLEALQLAEMTSNGELEIVA